MEKILENLWVLFIGLGSWVANRLTQKIDSLEVGKADSSSVGKAIKENSDRIHDLDKRVDELGNTTISRAEFKQDIISVHNRLNEQEQRKQDRPTYIKVVQENDKKKK